MTICCAHAGEMRDTAELGSMAGVMTERLMPRNIRANLFRSWGSLIGMLPVGGPNIWGNTTWAPDDSPAMAEKNETHGYSNFGIASYVGLLVPACCKNKYAMCLLEACGHSSGRYVLC